MKEFTAACVQIAVTPNDVPANVDKGIAWLEKAVSEYEAELVVFPETVTTSFVTGLEVEALWDLVDQVPGLTTRDVQAAAKSLGVHVVWPSYRRGPERGVIYNSAILIGPDGEIIGVYDKTHPFPLERRDCGGWVTVGQRADVFETALGSIGMTICYDGDFPELSRLLAVKGAEVIVRPSALLRSFDIWHITNAARAYDNHVYVIATNSVGPDAGGSYYFGHSMIVNPIAWRLAQARGGEEIVAARLDPDPLRYVTWGSKSLQIFDHLEDRNLALYEGILEEARSRFEPGQRTERRMTGSSFVFRLSSLINKHLEKKSMDIEKANTEATERMMEAHPVLVGLGKALDVIPGMRENLLLHAGPPLTLRGQPQGEAWQRASGPMRGAITGALILEGKATDEASAQALVESGEIELEPCHHHGAAGPMAGLISPSMSVYIIENKTHGNKSYSNLNEGYGKVLRYGAYSEDVLAKLRWMEEVMAPVLADAIAASGGIDIRALLAESLHMGDEGHNRNKAGSIIYTTKLAPFIAQAAPNPGVAADVLRALGENALSVLNPVMAACKAMADAAHGIEGSTIVTVMARNGTDFGIRISGLGDRWFTAPVATPQGLYFPGFTAQDASGDIGDSTITETAGIGGFAMASAPAIVTFVSGTPKDAINATMEMYEICYAEHKYFTMPPLNFRGTPTGIDVRKVVEKGITPRVNTGIAHKDAGVGQVGAGLVRPPMEMFEQALVAFAEQYGY